MLSTARTTLVGNDTTKTLSAAVITTITCSNPIPGTVSTRAQEARTATRSAARETPTRPVTSVASTASTKTISSTAHTRRGITGSARPSSAGRATATATTSIATPAQPSVPSLRMHPLYGRHLSRHPCRWSWPRHRKPMTAGTRARQGGVPSVGA